MRKIVRQIQCKRSVVIWVVPTSVKGIVLRNLYTFVVVLTIRMKENTVYILCGCLSGPCDGFVFMVISRPFRYGAVVMPHKCHTINIGRTRLRYIRYVNWSRVIVRDSIERLIQRMSHGHSRLGRHDSLLYYRPMTKLRRLHRGIRTEEAVELTNAYRTISLSQVAVG